MLAPKSDSGQADRDAWQERQPVKFSAQWCNMVILSAHKISASTPVGLYAASPFIRKREMWRSYISGKQSNPFFLFRHGKNRTNILVGITMDLTLPMLDFLQNFFIKYNSERS